MTGLKRFFKRILHFLRIRLRIKIDPRSSLFEKEGRILEISMIRESGNRTRIQFAKAGRKLDPAIVDKLFSFFDKVHPFYSENISQPLRIGGAWKGFFENERKTQLKLIEAGDREAYRVLLENMFCNELVAGVWNYGYWGSDDFLDSDFIAECDVFERISDRSSDMLAADDSFDRWGLETPAGIIRYMDPQHGTQAVHILRLINQYIPKHENPVLIMDIGSGFGGLAEKLHRWKERDMRIILFDIPLNLTTAYAYLAHTFGMNTASLVSCAEDISDAVQKQAPGSFILIPTLFAEEASKIVKPHIIHNAKSFSEMDQSTVDFYLSRFLTGKTECLIETNSNRKGSRNYDGHCEVLSRDLKVPSTHFLLSRFQDNRPGRYVTSIYLRRKNGAM